ncbi:MAG: TlpA family protein disulfide reductase [Flavisolibacter sp.]
MIKPIVVIVIFCFAITPACTQDAKLTEKMIFLPDSLKSFKQLLTLFKGQTVVLDMWGTWCGPCRKEINNNSAELKEYFAGRDVKFLYVANHDIGKEKQWKELISFYKLEGYHLLAKPSITNDIMNRIKSQEYPTYVVIDKYGNFERSKAGYPMNREVLIQQIEEAMEK